MSKVHDTTDNVLVSNISSKNVKLIIIVASIIVGALIIGLIVLLLVSNANNATPSVTSVVDMSGDTGNTDGSGKVTKACSPSSASFKTFQTCVSFQDCTNCSKTGSEEYECRAVGLENTTVNKDGKLVTPEHVLYDMPNGSTANERDDICRNLDKSCSCASSNTQIDCVFDTPGAYCLPKHGTLCASSTSNSVLASGSGADSGQFICECKPEYEGMFAQNIESGECDTPLICGAGDLQRSFSGMVCEKDADCANVAGGMTSCVNKQCVTATGKAYRLYETFTKIDANGTPVFEKLPVLTNRVTTFNQFLTEDCVSKTRVIGNGGDTANDIVTIGLDPETDPTCRPLLYSNLCTSNVYTTNFSIADVLKIKVRGSDRVGDSLLSRVYPNFFPPVPMNLQRCPDGYSGKNTVSDPCRDATGTSLEFMPSLTSACGSSSVHPDTVPDTDPGTGVWYSSMFDNMGEWNGGFTCLNDIRTAKYRVVGSDPSVNPSNVKNLLWKMVNASPISEVQCDETVEWLTRDQYNSDTKKPNYKNCVGSMCEGVKGTRAKVWDGYRDGPLLNSNDLPWFVTTGGNTFGGQCECTGVQYRAEGTQEVPLVASSSFIDMLNHPITAANNDMSYWQCRQDSCWSSDHPGIKFDPVSRTCNCQLSVDSAWHARVQHSKATEIDTAPWSTRMNFTGANGEPTCIADACNPHGISTTTIPSCTTATDCNGVCYGRRCHYPRSNIVGCMSDAACIDFELGAGLKGRCVAPSVIDPLNNKPNDDDPTNYVCIYEDPERSKLNMVCDTNTQCSYGMCNDVSGGGVSGVGVCGGGCACNPDTMQQRDNASPRGETCVLQCKLLPCANGGVCSVDADGVRQCACDATKYKGSSCEIVIDITQCPVNPCLNGGVCYYDGDGTTRVQKCKCDDTKYSGDHCEIVK